MKTLLAAGLLALLAVPAWAGDDRVPPVADPLTLKECGSCHMAFQPAFLPAESWRTIMANLADHFGDNAEMAPEKVKAVTDYLVAHAGRGRWGQTSLRITEAGWFTREHRKVPETAWTSKQVVSKANCPACHQGAEKGIYEDD